MVSQSSELNEIMASYSTNAHQLEGENRILRDTVSQLRNELGKFKEPALMVCDVVDIIKDKAIVKTPNGNRFFVNMACDCKENILPGDSVLTEQKNLTVIKKIPNNKKFGVEQFVIVQKPEVKWSQVGGLTDQMRELHEVIELPLKQPELFKNIGILPPKGILLHGPPGTGKTLLAKAVANSTNSTFIEIVGSELVQKFIGEGAKLVKEIFQLAREKAPSIVFIDELDAIAAKRIEVGTSGEREVQRTFMQFLAELDGFKNLDNVKLIGCTNRRDVLDPAITRPGRLDRLIEVPNPDCEGIEEIFKIHTKNMNLNKNVKKNLLCRLFEGMSGAEIQAVATEAGYFAIREKRTMIFHSDFANAVNKIKEKDTSDEHFRKMFC
jgi:proteasome regulatory subunit